MFFRGGVLRFGKLTMHDTDLMIVDAEPEDPFDSFLDQYNAQLVAGSAARQGTFELSAEDLDDQLWLIALLAMTAERA